MRKHHRISVSTETPEPRDFTVRDAPLVRANEVRARPATSTAFLSHATDDPDAPLEWIGTKTEHKLICGGRQIETACGKLTRRAKRVAAVAVIFDGSAMRAECTDLGSELDAEAGENPGGHEVKNKSQNAARSECGPEVDAAAQ